MMSPQAPPPDGPAIRPGDPNVGGLTTVQKMFVAGTGERSEPVNKTPLIVGGDQISRGRLLALCCAYGELHAVAVVLSNSSDPLLKAIADTALSRARTRMEGGTVL